jgi:hypothetical protein
MQLETGSVWEFVQHFEVFGLVSVITWVFHCRCVVNVL